MRSDVARDMVDAMDDFLRVVFPALEHLFDPGRIVAVEGMTDDPVRQALDRQAGIDYLHVGDKGVCAIASRIQYGDKSWGTTTLRFDRNNGRATEWEKRMAVLLDGHGGLLFPAVTIHAYLKPPRGYGELIEVGMCRTDHLLRFAVDHPGDQRANGSDGVIFRAFRWGELRAAGYPVLIVRGDGSAREGRVA